MSTQLSLFPLNTLLVPDATLDLRIFEQRYLRLIKDCIRDDSCFGVVPIRDGNEVGQPAMIYQLGVTARVVEWDQGADGLLQIQVRGERKFRVLQTSVAEDQLMQAQVEYLADEEQTQIPDQYQALYGLYERLREHPDAQPLHLIPAEDARQLGWFLTMLLPISRPDQIRLLALDDPLQRLHELQELL